MDIYVGNLPYEVSDEELEAVFAEYGQVVSARVITDRFSGRPRGFGFVEMGNDSEAQAAIDALNGRDLKGRPLTVNQARPARLPADDGPAAAAAAASAGNPRSVIAAQGRGSPLAPERPRLVCPCHPSPTITALRLGESRLSSIALLISGPA